ncbi:MAG: HAD family hydrolase, partial [Planctomycetes bacterium]|nr:HAD family hydrolase [Planctomycetota bacterium]
LDASQLESVVERVLQGYRTWAETIRSRSAVHVVIHNLEKPAQAAAGIYDAQCANGQLRAIERINAELVALCGEFTGVHVLDYDGLVARHGRDHWHDDQKWLTARLPIAADSLIHLANEWIRYLLPICGRQAKCLVCDLDNTLWGGVIGEDGLHGIKLGGDYPGAAYQDLQRAILDLTRRGIILAICSKNNEADALEAIQRHPEMLLRRKDFSAMRINWNDKAQNLREIAAELNIGVDSLVLVDDNPVEREFVREMIPEATVIDIDAAAPLGHAAALQRCPLLERLEISAEDRQRGQLYAQQQQRRASQSSTTTVEDYYRSLEMVAAFGLADEATRPRIAQLTQKTNQLNMTTRRYSEQDIQSFIDDPAVHVYWVRIEDRFGDNGIIGVMIVREKGADWLLDTFLMSCRVIGRTVETAMLGVLVEQARRQGAQRLLGEFLPTAKNAPAKEIYTSHGFRCTKQTDHESWWELELSNTTLTAPEWIECRVGEHQGVNE